MKKLAIKGHTTRGKEVIELFEMLGGINTDNYRGNDEIWLYFVDDFGDIDWCHEATTENEFISFTLEEFLEKFPYKVGDKVQRNGATSCGSIYVIEQMKWEDTQVKYVICDLYWKNCKCTVISKDLQPYKEETMEEKENYAVFNIEHKQLKVNSLRFDKTQLVINNEYELKQERDAYYIVRKKLQYPKTYEECCDVLKIEYPFFKTEEDGISASTYKNKLFGALKQLLICRDAYWKIAGEQMGLGKPWEPDTCQIVYSIGRDSNRISFCNDMFGGYFILEFTTVEMRDAFYENFKDLIEKCTELL